MSCPYHKAQQQPEATPAAAPATDGNDEAPAKKCPFHGKSMAEVQQQHHQDGGAADGGEMCSHARAKLEREKANAALRNGHPANGEVDEHGRPRHLPQQDWKAATGDDLKAHFTLAYNLVAENVASRQSQVDSAKVAQVLMQRLGYTAGDMEVIGHDAWVMQGTGNPHIMANVQPGESVVDFGSGFGMDAFLAAKRVGPTGRVVGIDLSIGEITSAIQRASLRRLRNVDFRLGDMEDAPFVDGSVDVVLSNGGFCLVPNKRKAFSEIYRILKPGGRMTISCTTLRQTLDPQYDWPSCFVVFMPLNSVESMLTDIGFANVKVDDSNARMDMWDEVKKDVAKEDPAAVEAAENRAKKATIHSNNPKFDFLKGMNMNDLCARVNVYAEKPRQQ